VQAQINQLNADYSRTNSDAGNTPSVWQSIAPNCEVQFCLAQRDPNGNATNGIIHNQPLKHLFQIMTMQSKTALVEMMHGLQDPISISGR
jgi:hypothetical protein